MKRIMLVGVGLVCVASLLFLFRLWSLGRDSQTMAPKGGLEADKLRACGQAMRCVSSVKIEDPAYVAPVTVPKVSGDLLRERITLVAEQMGGRLVRQNGGYFHFEYKSTMFGFVDDFEVHVSGTGTVDVRSESRVGKSDLGVNRKRVEQFRQLVSEP